MPSAAIELGGQPKQGIKARVRLAVDARPQSAESPGQHTEDVVQLPGPHKSRVECAVDRSHHVIGRRQSCEMRERVPQRHALLPVGGVRKMLPRPQPVFARSQGRDPARVLRNGDPKAVGTRDPHPIAGRGRTGSQATAESHCSSRATVGTGMRHPTPPYRPQPAAVEPSPQVTFGVAEVVELCSPGEVPESCHVLAEYALHPTIVGSCRRVVAAITAIGGQTEPVRPCGGRILWRMPTRVGRARRAICRGRTEQFCRVGSYRFNSNDN